MRLRICHVVAISDMCRAPQRLAPQPPSPSETLDALEFERVGEKVSLSYVCEDVEI